MVDHLNRHHNATQALVALAGKPTLVVVAPKEFDFSTLDHLSSCGPSFATAQPASTCRWPRGTGARTPLMDHVDLVNVQGAGFLNDNEVAYLERDLGVVVNVRL